MDEAFQGLTNIRKIVDDVVAYDDEEHQHVEHVRAILRRCKDRPISLNREKLQFCQTKVRFAGMQLTQQGYSVSADIIAAIANSQHPQLIPTFAPFVASLTS